MRPRRTMSHAVLEHPHLAPVLGLVRRRRRLEGERFRLVDRAPSALHHEVGKRKVVPEARIDLDVVRPAERVDRAVAGRDRAEPRLGLAGHELIAPVDALLVLPARRLEPRRPHTYATCRSARLRTSFRSASGAQVAFASEKATTSASVCRTAASCAATFPPRGFRITRAPPPRRAPRSGRWRRRR